MIIDDRHYDVIIIGSGAGGGTLAGALSRKGHQVLLLERGGAMALEDQNVADVDLFRKDRYHPKNERWFGPDGDPFAPQTTYALGGNTKIWGAALERMREKDFGEVPLQDGVSPSWPFDYASLAPYYDAAETLYQVHGQAGVDPTEPSRSAPFPHAPKPLLPFLEPLRDGLQRQGCQPYDLPLSWSADPEDPSGDAQIFGLNQADPNTLETRALARVTRLHTSPDGREVKGVEAEVAGELWLFSADLVVLAAGAINTAAILLRSSSDRHPRGLSNGSDQVGRNLMNLQLTSILQLAAEANDGRYARSFGINDYYWGDKNVSFPLGHLQSAGGVLQDALFAESPPVLSLVSKLIPDFGLERLASRSVAWWAMTEVRPDPHNKVWLHNDQIRINYLHNNREAHDRLVYRWIDTLKAVEADPVTRVVTSAPTHPRGEAPLSVVGYACGTCRMGQDPAASVVDATGKCHELNNLYVADTSVFPSCPSVGPGLTVIALALRLADQLDQRLQA
ncbi:Glucose-methanol-choline (GMC) oxidoreductase:NAD binding site [Synechococcus sp. WH 8101]|uniref:GMC oxidoreductase n=1 Tax=Synechococcus sp. WH 8101 TaxID=59932 RepID=UPI0010232808|nr:GMC family oxidoreductase [Synechococcus sp. WH 8101]QBE69531.1 Glucose-methanol-choline (GMC) oxidoreductase:NAD binding site [Synechococcus sp. WH 8101]QNI45781.1 glucose-methanol-choline oxidoreductase family protein [Synechococcus sp. WH 8101]